jgi:hypothetical protein
LADRRDSGEHAENEVGLLQGALSDAPAKSQEPTPVGVA